MKATYGPGFSKRQLEMFRKFYLSYPIASALRTQFTWTHYKLLLSVDNQIKREFYETEAVKNTWSSRQLERQINSHLYERLLMSNNPEEVLSIARSEKQPADVKSIIPRSSEFLTFYHVYLIFNIKFAWYDKKTPISTN